MMPRDRIAQPGRADGDRRRPGVHLGDDGSVRAFDSETGRELWKYQLPAGGQATPMTYTVQSKQYVVIAAGGHGKLGTKQGDYVMAFGLP
jgi:quinoprotein glucose dehydrogenase